MIQFKLCLSDGEVIEETKTPMRIIIGAGDLHFNIEKLLLGKYANEHISRLLRTEEAFGVAESDNIQLIAATLFEQDLSVNEYIEFALPNGETVAGKIIANKVMKKGKKWVEVDFNHPLCGLNLQFECDIINVCTAEVL